MNSFESDRKKVLWKNGKVIGHLHICLSTPWSPHPPQFCIGNVFNFCRDDCYIQEKWIAKVIQTFRGGGGRCIMERVQKVNWKSWNLKSSNVCKPWREINLGLNVIICFSFFIAPSQSPINVRAFNKTSPTQITVQWNPIPDKFYVHGILRGYKLLYSAIAIANEKLEELETYEVTVGPSTLIAVLKNLTAFTRYEVRVLAFTVKGDGVKSTPIRAGNSDDYKNNSWFATTW